MLHVLRWPEIKRSSPHQAVSPAMIFSCREAVSCATKTSNSCMKTWSIMHTSTLPTPEMYLSIWTRDVDVVPRPQVREEVPLRHTRKLCHLSCSTTWETPHFAVYCRNHTKKQRCERNLTKQLHQVHAAEVPQKPQGRVTAVSCDQ